MTNITHKRTKMDNKSQVTLQPTEMHSASAAESRNISLFCILPNWARGPESLNNWYNNHWGHHIKTGLEFHFGESDPFLLCFSCHLTLKQHCNTALTLQHRGAYSALDNYPQLQLMQMLSRSTKTRINF